MKKILYRTENTYGSGVRDVNEVIKYEVLELGNIDILDYCITNYDLPENLSDDLLSLMNQIEDGDEPDERKAEKLIKNLTKEISRLSGKNIKYALWLAEKDVVKKLYDGTTDDIEAYPCSDVILSDLGDDGILFGYSELPHPIVESFDQMFN